MMNYGLVTLPIAATAPRQRAIIATSCFLSYGRGVQ